MNTQQIPTARSQALLALGLEAIKLVRDRVIDADDLTEISLLLQGLLSIEREESAGAVPTMPLVPGGGRAAVRA